MSHWSSEESSAHRPTLNCRGCFCIHLCQSHTGYLFIQARNDKYSCQQCLHMFYHCDKALTNNEVSKPHGVFLWICTPWGHSSSCFFHPHTDLHGDVADCTFIKVEFTVVSKKSRWTITEVSPKSILTHGASCRHGWDPHPSIPNS